MAIVRPLLPTGSGSTSEGGVITLTASAPGLGTTKVTITTN